jgi:hypothetical protein
VWHRHTTRRAPCQRPFWAERISRLFMKWVLDFEHARIAGMLRAYEIIERRLAA